MSSIPVLVLFLGFLAEPLVKRVRNKTSLLLPSSFNEKQRAQWTELTEGNEGGKFIGWIERFMFFVALLSSAEQLLIAWLAFKVASKWNAWTNVIAVPKEVGELNDLDFLIARRRWASNVLATFLVGTGFNILVAILGVAVTRHWKEISSLVGC